MTTEQRVLLERFIRLVSAESKYTSEDDDQWLAENWWVVREMRLTDSDAEIQRNHWVTAYEVRFKPAKRDLARVLTASEMFLILGAVKVGEP
jgi:type IV secretory pathway TrbF-like protein